MNSSAPGARLALERLTKTYPGEGLPAVAGVDLQIEAGEFVTLLGPSGSGKTTTLNMIAGFVPVTSGRVMIDDRDVARLPPHRRDLGYVFQSYALFPHMSVADNIAYPLRRRRTPRAAVAQRVDEVASLVELGALLHRRPSELSGGQQQRVALARALAARPRVLLLDEPLAALDRQLRESLQDELRRLHRELGTTILLVTHDQQEAFHLSDRIAVFHQGRLDQTGTPASLYRSPETLFVARFFGESSTLPGRIVSRGRLAVGDLVVPVTDELPVGSSAVVVVRPEAVSVGVDGARADHHVTEATVVDVVFRGASIRISLDLGAGVPLTATIPDNASVPRPGDRVSVGWNPTRAPLIAEQEPRKESRP
ncbi:ABC transporter ATP-binding protein [Leifsonia aquatica]|uniref:ABC transporter ATP-binding protein n=1 Tax=Leifsonia aquatica TaxID=144185 RepID=UPI0028AA4B97|nr:ABC transporter ATP-binding protein [Leifsonia aquatica]